MKRVEIVKDALSFSEFVAGFWRLDEWNLAPQDILSKIKDNLDLGITTTDHADIYGDFTNEQLFGEALMIEPSIRNSIEIVTKCDIAMVCDAFPNRTTDYYDTSAIYIEESVNQSLKNFRTDRIDLLLIHRPDPLLNADEVASTFQKLKDSGKVLNFGVSNFTPWQFDLLQSRLDFKLATNQIELNIINKSPLHDGTLDHAQQHSYLPMIWSPLSGGDLFTQKTDQIMRIKKVAQHIAKDLNTSETAVYFAWILKLPSNPIPIIGSKSKERIIDAIKGSKIELSREQWFSLWEASEGNPVP